MKGDKKIHKLLAQFLTVCTVNIKFIDFTALNNQIVFFNRTKT